MVGMSFYPYKLQKLVNGTATQNANGNFVAPDGSYEFVCNCRDEKSTATDVLAINEGKITKSRSVSIYCPKGSPALPPGTQIQVVDGCDTVRASGQIVESESNRLHTVQWL